MTILISIQLSYLSIPGLGLWCLMPLSTIFHIYRGGFISGGNLSHKAKIEKNCLFPTPDRLLENVATQNIFLRDLRRLIFI